MKKYLILGVVFISALLSGCSRDDGCDDGSSSGTTSVTDNYYVKYKVFMPLLNSNSLREITYVTEKGTQSFSTLSREWEGTYGPLKKGTKLFISVVTDGTAIYDIESYVVLSVSKNKEAFVNKGEERKASATSLYASYTIDF